MWLLPKPINIAKLLRQWWLFEVRLLGKGPAYRQG